MRAHESSHILVGFLIHWTDQICEGSFTKRTQYLLVPCGVPSTPPPSLIQVKQQIECVQYQSQMVHGEPREEEAKSKDNSQWQGKIRGAWRLNQTLSCRGPKLPVRATHKEPFLFTRESCINAQKMILGKNLSPYKAQKRSSHHRGCCPTQPKVLPRATFTELSNLNFTQ